MEISVARTRKTVVINPDSPNARLAQAIQELKVTQAELGRRTKVGSPYVNDVLRGRRSISEPFAEYLQSEFGINKIWLRYGEGPMFRRFSPSASVKGAVAGFGLAQLPLLDRPCDGNSQENEAWLGSTHPVPLSLANPSASDRHRYVLRIAGYGTSGEIRDGDLVLVENAGGFSSDELACRLCVVATAGIGKIRRIAEPKDRLEIWGRCIGILWRGLH